MKKKLVCMKKLKTMIIDMRLLVTKPISSKFTNPLRRIKKCTSLRAVDCINYVGSLNENNSLLTVEEIALRDFLSKNISGSDVTESIE